MAKQKKEYIYSSTELSRYYGISIKGMAFYEEKGLIHPERIGSGMTRRFGLSDCYRLASARMLHNCGFSTDETALMLRDNTVDAIWIHLSRRADALEKELLLQQGVITGLNRISGLIEQIRSGNTAPGLTVMPAMMRLFVRQFCEEHTSTRDETAEFQQWNNLMPITEASLLVPADNILSGCRKLETGIGMVVAQEDFLRFGLEESSRVKVLPATEAIHGLVRFRETELDDPDSLSGIIAFAKENHLVPNGDGISRMVFVLQQGHENIRWDEFWLPVRREETP